MSQRGVMRRQNESMRRQVSQRGGKMSQRGVTEEAK